jgi:hypothetical protein
MLDFQRTLLVGKHSICTGKSHHIDAVNAMFLHHVIYDALLGPAVNAVDCSSKFEGRHFFQNLL